MFKVLKFIVISVVCLIIMGASVLYGFSSLFAPPNMDETLIPDAASQFYDINGNAIYTTLSEERRIPVTTKVRTLRFHHYPAAGKECFPYPGTFHHP